MAQVKESLTAFLQRLRAWYEGSLINRVAIKAQALMCTILLFIALIIWPLVFSLVQEAVSERLGATATLSAQRLQSEVDRIMQDMEGLARRSLVANALADSISGNAYLRPFLVEFRQSFADLEAVSLVDGLGQVVASSDPMPKFRSSTLQRAMAQEKAVFELEVEAGKAVLHMAYPVGYLATGRTEGIIVSELNLSALAKRHIDVATSEDKLPRALVLSDGAGRVIFRSGEFLEGEVLPVERAIGGRLADSGQPLTLTVSAAKSAAYAPMLRITLAMVLIAFFAIVVVMIMTRKISQNIIAPLGEMSHRAMEIAGAGPSELRELPVRRTDEIGWMGTAFNEMVYSLRNVYASQENEVQRRTDELAEARERLAGVLANIDDVVYSTSPDFQVLEYISPAAAKVFGCTPEQFITDRGLIYSMIQHEDRSVLVQARSTLASAKTAEVRYRVRRADGAVRWVLDRFHLVLDENGYPLRVSGIIRDVTAMAEAEASLRLRERALASSSCGVVISDMRLPGQPILYVNQAFEDITGYSAAEVMGRNCSLLQGVEGSDQDAVNEVRQAISTGRSCKVVLRNYRKNGEAFWNELQLSPLADEQGVVTHYIGIQNDITPNISATKALVESEQRLALTIDALHEGVWDWNVTEDLLFTSPSWFAILGLDAAAATTVQGLAKFMRFLPEDWQGRFREELDAHMQGQDNEFFFEHQMLHADGKRIWVANHGRVVERDAEGNPLRMVGTIVDISQRIESAQQIIGLMRQLDAIFTLSPDGFAYFDGDGRLSFVNPAFERMTGVQSGMVSGLSLVEFSNCLQGRADPMQAFPANSGDGMPFDQEGQLLHLLQPTRRVLLVSRRASGDGGASVVYLRDVTRETEVDRMKSEFLTTAAHELRTPMASIMGFAELLMMREFSPERTRDMLSTVHRQARRLTDLINELLDLARIEARQGKDFKLEHRSVVPVVQDAVAALHIDGDRSRMQLHLPEVSPELNIDPAKLQQAVINLLSNAYKYSPNGGAIDISVLSREGGGKSEVGIVVRDHGIGMTPEQTERVFERFFRADPSGNIPGTGLGMSLVKEIMDAHGGRVEVGSVYGDGTTVSLWLPLHAEVKASDEIAETNIGAAHGELTLWLPTTELESSQQLH